MHKRKVEKLGLQVFAAPDNMTGQAQIQVRAREIDFVTSFGKNLQALLDILGITRMIRKENGSALKTKEVKGTLQSGDVPEGNEIPLSQYTVEEKVFDTIKIDKYRKSVSIEAIAERGYVPVEVDGRQIAKATATYTKEEIEKQQKRDLRKKGKR